MRSPWPARSDAAGLEHGAPGSDARLTLVPVTLAKGLEFDHVIVVEPALIAQAEARGLHRLYVALTRAVSRLTVLHAEPLPAPLPARGRTVLNGPFVNRLPVRRVSMGRGKCGRARGSPELRISRCALRGRQRGVILDRRRHLVFS